LIAGVNDRLDQTKPCPSRPSIARESEFNPLQQSRGSALGAAPASRRRRIPAALENQKVTATLRREKGHDIDAACGQLRLKTERALSKPA